MTRHATARLFVAVDPPEEVCEQLTAWARGALRAAGGRRGPGHPVRVLEPDTLHVTLSFLGERPMAEIDAIATQLPTLASGEGTGELSVGAPLWLPPRRPRVLAVELHDDEGQLERLQRRLAAALREISSWEDEHHPGGGGGGRGESRGHGVGHHRFRPHVTLARMREGAAPRERALPPTPALAFTPRELVLYRSWLRPEGASYEALASCVLG